MIVFIIFIALIGIFTTKTGIIMYSAIDRAKILVKKIYKRIVFVFVFLCAMLMRLSGEF